VNTDPTLGRKGYPPLAKRSRLMHIHCMCNLYNFTISQDAIREWTRAMRDIMATVSRCGASLRGAGDELRRA